MLLRRVLTVLISILVILSLAAGGAAVAFTKVLPPRSFPQVAGELQVGGLEQPVDIYRDPLGVPHIYAATTHDLFFAQGYVHAQERFWQMDFWRHIGSGRLSEMFGKSQLDTDIFLRRMGWARVVREELAQMDPQSLAILEAYSSGVNAYLKDHSGAALSLEYAVLKLLTPGYTVEPWEPLHTLTWAKAMAWDLRGNMDEEGERAGLLKLFTPAQVDELYPAYDITRPTIVNRGLSAVSDQRSARSRPQAAISVPYSAISIQQSAIQERLAALDELLGPGGTGFGSNNWVISGARTASGKPLLANDPHLGPQMPSIWFEVGLHCRPKGDACPLELVGFSFAGAPGVVIGHNDRIAWGFTNVGPDVQDIYIEKINPAQPNQYEVNGAWVEMQSVEETILVAGGQPVTITVRTTRHGPVLWEDEEVIQKFAQESGVPLPEQYRLALRWTALDPSSTFPALWKIDTARNWDEFRAAAKDWDVPAQNFVYADVDGNIGYQMPGRIPIRAGGDGRTYVPGWTDAYEWTGYIPFEDLPHVFNPPEGFIATANNAVVDSSYPYFIGSDWDAGFRAARIVAMIQAAPGPIDAAYIQKMQGDNLNQSFVFILPALRGALEAGSFSQPRQSQAWDLLQAWDGQQGSDSTAAALYQSFWKELLRLTFQDDLPETFWPSGDSRWWAVVQNLLAQPESKWWDNHSTPEVETRDAILRQAFAAGLAELEKLQGTDAAKWNWGQLHTITFRNKSLGESGVAPLEALLNRGPYATSGGEAIVNATGWDATQGFEVDWLPSMRMIVDLGEFSRSLAVHTTGQSGHAFNPHYADMVDLWRAIQYAPMRWDETEIETSAEAHLRLDP
jgi:penicillin G amidase